jgi:hypothetical protein
LDKLESIGAPALFIIGCLSGTIGQVIYWGTDDMLSTCHRFCYIYEAIGDMLGAQKPDPAHAMLWWVVTALCLAGAFGSRLAGWVMRKRK